MPPVSLPTPLVSTHWLAEHLRDAHVKVVDATMYLPGAGRDARAEYVAGHIPSAVFCDIGYVSDESSPLPHTMPSAELFAERVGSLGIGSDDAVIVYDSSGQNFSAPRLWWLFRTFGHARVSVLDGGLRKWQAEARAISTDIPSPTHAAFHAELAPERVRDLEAMRANLASHDANPPAAQVADARSPGRFAGAEPEPRPGVRSGHIPGSTNVHYARLVNADGTLRSATELREIMQQAGLDLAQPIIASCGSGVTACAVLLALDTLGVKDIAMYDGSWTEWGGASDTPVQTGA